MGSASVELSQWSLCPPQLDSTCSDVGSASVELRTALLFHLWLWSHFIHFLIFLSWRDLILFIYVNFYFLLAFLLGYSLYIVPNILNLSKNQNTWNIYYHSFHQSSTCTSYNFLPGHWHLHVEHVPSDAKTSEIVVSNFSKLRTWISNFGSWCSRICEFSSKWSPNIYAQEKLLFSSYLSTFLKQFKGTK